MTSSDDRLCSAESVALDRLITIARDSECEREARLAAEAIFTIRRAIRDQPEEPTATAPATPARPEHHEPLTTDELSELIILLPQVNPQRFVRKHTPKHWRTVLDQQRLLNRDPARAIGPPAAKDAA